MNIDDVDANDVEKGVGDKLDQMFLKQRELMIKYHHIENDNGLLITPDVPVNLHDAKGQYRLKDFAWRITEEVGEAMEAIRTHPELRDHYDEEIADALHFLIEFTILAGAGPDLLMGENPDGSPFEDKLDSAFEWSRITSNRKYDYISMSVGRFIEALSVTCNCLKNKPWKNTQMMTDVSYFYTNLTETWYRFIHLCHTSRIDSQRLYDLYFRKSEVNKFRQRSNY